MDHPSTVRPSYNLDAPTPAQEPDSASQMLRRIAWLNGRIDQAEMLAATLEQALENVLRPDLDEASVPTNSTIAPVEHLAPLTEMVVAAAGRLDAVNIRTSRLIDRLDV